MIVRFLVVIVTLYFCSVVGSIPVYSQAVSELESPELLMGELTRLTVSVPLPNDTAVVSFPRLKQAIEEKRDYFSLLNDTIEILTDYKQSMDCQDDRYWMKYALLIQAFDSGRYELPPLEFFVGKDTVRSNSVILNVIPVKVKADDDIEPFSDILPPFEIAPEDMLKKADQQSNLLWWLIGAAAVIAGIIIFLYIYFRKTGRIFLSPKKPEPAEVALKALKKLKEQNLPAKGKTKDYYTRLSEIVRTFLHRQFGIKTIERTTPEILSDVADNEKIYEYYDLLKSIFDTSDFVKFAKVTPSDIENARCMSEAVKFIEESRPVAGKDEVASISPTGNKEEGGES